MAMTKVIAALLLLIPVLFGMEAVFAQDGQMLKKELRQIFALYTKCQLMNLVVEDLGRDAAKIGLTRAMIVAAAESRLRSARIFTDKLADSYLYINVNVVGPAVAIDFSFKKLLHDDLSGLNGFGHTWSRGKSGTHGGSEEIILSSVGNLMDEFLVEYLRVNEKACERK